MEGLLVIATALFALTLAAAAIEAQTVVLGTAIAAPGQSVTFDVTLSPGRTFR